MRRFLSLRFELNLNMGKYFLCVVPLFYQFVVLIGREDEEFECLIKCVFVLPGSF